MSLSSGVVQYLEPLAAVLGADRDLGAPLAAPARAGTLRAPRRHHLVRARHPQRDRPADRHQCGTPLAHRRGHRHHVRRAGVGPARPWLAGDTVIGAVSFDVLFGLGFGADTITRPALLAEAYGAHGHATLSAPARSRPHDRQDRRAGHGRSRPHQHGTCAPVLAAVIAASVITSWAFRASGQPAGPAPDGGDGD